MAASSQLSCICVANSRLYWFQTRLKIGFRKAIQLHLEIFHPNNVPYDVLWCRWKLIHILQPNAKTTIFVCASSTTQLVSQSHVKLHNRTFSTDKYLGQYEQLFPKEFLFPRFKCVETLLPITNFTSIFVKFEEKRYFKFPFPRKWSFMTAFAEELLWESFNQVW